MKPRRLRGCWRWTGCGAVVLATLTGCGGDGARPVAGEAFRNPAAVGPVKPVGPVDQPGSVLPAPPTPAKPDESVRSVSPTVAASVKSPAEESPDPAAGAAATRPSATSPTTLATGQYLTVGAVVAEVNGVAVYADKVLAWVEKDLAAKARQMPESDFRRYAAGQLNKSRDYFINNELVFAAAQRSLDAKERELAEALTTNWRQRKITEAGGSVELARRQASAQGLSFEELVNEQYRTFMAQIYYQKKVMPRIQISAMDLRDYYRDHLSDEFTDHDQVHFRLIKIDPRETGGREQAIAKVKEIQDQAAKGFDFVELAKTHNRDESLQRAGGDVGWVDKNAFRLEKVEKAVWALQPGQVTSDFVEEDGVFYVAKLEERKVGRVAPFEDPAVQDTIYGKLRARQFKVLQEKAVEALKRDAIIDLKNDNLEIVLEMAMQRYPAWLKGA